MACVRRLPVSTGSGRKATQQKGRKTQFLSSSMPKPNAKTKKKSSWKARFRPSVATVVTHTFSQLQHPSAEARGGGNSSSSSKEEEENVPSAVRKFSTGLLRWWCGACCRVPPGHLAYLVQLFPTKEGRRSTPRVREPAPAVEGLFKRFKGAHFSRTSPPPSDSGRKTNSLQNTPPPRKSGTIR